MRYFFLFAIPYSLSKINVFQKIIPFDPEKLLFGETGLQWQQAHAIFEAMNYQLIRRPIMIAKIAESMASFYAERDLIPAQDVTSYKYGFEILLSTICGNNLEMCAC